MLRAFTIKEIRLPVSLQQAPLASVNREDPLNRLVLASSSSSLSFTTALALLPLLLYHQQEGPHTLGAWSHSRFLPAKSGFLGIVSLTDSSSELKLLTSATHVLKVSKKKQKTLTFPNIYCVWSQADYVGAHKQKPLPVGRHKCEVRDERAFYVQERQARQRLSERLFVLALYFFSLLTSACEDKGGKREHTQ